MCQKVYMWIHKVKNKVAEQLNQWNVSKGLAHSLPGLTDAELKFEVEVRAGAFDIDKLLQHSEHIKHSFKHTFGNHENKLASLEATLLQNYGLQ